MTFNDKVEEVVNLIKQRNRYLKEKMKFNNRWDEVIEH